MDQKPTEETKRDASEIGRKKLMVFFHEIQVMNISSIFKIVTARSAKTNLP